MGHNTILFMISIQRENSIGCSPEFKCTYFLEVLAFEEQLTIEDFVELL
jgi:hypothetical protein